MRKLVESTFTTLDGVIGDPHTWGPPFAEAWPKRGGDPSTDKMNSMPKHVASRTLTEATWNAEIIQRDVAEAVATLKEGDGGDILKYGTGELDRTLIEEGWSTSLAEDARRRRARGARRAGRGVAAMSLAATPCPSPRKRNRGVQR